MGSGSYWSTLRDIPTMNTLGGRTSASKDIITRPLGTHFNLSSVLMNFPSLSRRGLLRCFASIHLKLVSPSTISSSVISPRVSLLITPLTLFMKRCFWIFRSNPPIPLIFNSFSASSAIRWMSILSLKYFAL